MVLVLIDVMYKILKSYSLRKHLTNLAAGLGVLGVVFLITSLIIATSVNTSTRLIQSYSSSKTEQTTMNISRSLCAFSYLAIVGEMIWLRFRYTFPMQHTFSIGYGAILWILVMSAIIQLFQLFQMPLTVLIAVNIALAVGSMVVSVLNIWFVQAFSGACIHFNQQRKLIEDLQYVVYHIRLSLVRVDIIRETLSALHKIHPEHRFFIQASAPPDVVDNLDMYSLQDFSLNDGDVNLFVARVVRSTNVIPKIWLETVCQQVTQAFEHAHLLENAIAVADLKSEFLSMMSHEIRTPLTGVINMLDLLTSTSMSVEQSEYIETAQLSGNMLLAIINDILDYTKIEAGKLIIGDSMMDLSSTFHAIEMISAANTATKSISLYFSSHVDPILNYDVFGDEERLRQVAINLTGNAIKFTPRGKVTVEFSCSTPEYNSQLGFIATQMELTVADTGIGIPHEYVQQIFQPFTQVGVGYDKVKLAGTGLGLAICNRLVRMMKGTIVIKSELGDGTVARVNIPLRARLKPIANTAVGKDNSGMLQLAKAVPRCSTLNKPFGLTDEAKADLRVLFAEDNIVNRRTIVRILSKIGYTNVSVVDNGAAALDEYLNNGPFDVILLDNIMPMMNGDEVCKKIRETDKNQIIICISANALANDHRHFWEIGMNDIISKPVDIKELQTKLDHWRALKESERET